MLNTPNVEAAVVAPRAPGISGRTRIMFFAVLAYGALAQIAQLVDGWHHNVFARQPIGDAAYYWAWAGRIAEGEWAPDHPFLAAPLYPYFLGLLRACGATLPFVHAIQGLLWLAAAALTGSAAGKLIRPAAAPIAAALFVVLRDPAYYAGRLLSAELQVFLLAWFAWEISHWTRPARLATSVRMGVALGLGALANPAMMWLIPGVFLWIVFPRLANARELRAAFACSLVALLCIAPATLHNRRASGDWIAIAGHGGLTFAHGNSPRADGTYFPVPGVSTGAHQDLDVLRVASAALGHSATWAEADAHFMGLGLQFWREHTSQALRLTARKVWWFFGGRNYGESYVPALENEAGFTRFAWTTPVPVPWIVAAGCVGLLVLAWRRPRCAPLVLAALGVVATNVVFFYSPRYRLPALPLLALGAVALVFFAIESGRSPLWRVAVATLFAGSLSFGPLQRRQGFDGLDPLRAMFASNLGTAWLSEGDAERAEETLRRAADSGVRIARGPLAEILRSRGDVDGAIQLLARDGGPAREDSVARRTLGIALAQAGRNDEARRVLESVSADYPADVRALGALGNVALAQEHPDEALAHFDAALALDSSAADLHFNRGIAVRALGRESEAFAAWRRALELDPKLVSARFQLLDHAVANGEWKEALDLASAGHRHNPENRWISSWLAWLQATVPDSSLRNGPAALALATELVPQQTSVEAELLDTLAAAFAENGRFEEAVATAERAVAQLRAEGEDAMASEIEGRASSYRARKPYRLSAP